MRTIATAAAVAAGLAFGAAADESDDCAPVHSQVDFCGEAHHWTQLEIEKIEGLAVFRNTETGVGKVIVERTVGGDVTRKRVENAILRNLVLSQGGADKSFTVDRIENGKVDGLVAGLLEYRLPDSADDALTLHSYLVAGDLVMQFITITPAEVLVDTARTLHREFLGGFRISSADYQL